MTRTSELIKTFVLCVASVECHDWTGVWSRPGPQWYRQSELSSSGKVQTFRCAQERSEPCPHRRRGPASQLPSVTRGTYFKLFPKERTKKCFSVRILKCVPISQHISDIRHLLLLQNWLAICAPGPRPVTGAMCGLAACVRPGPGHKRPNILTRWRLGEH